MTTKEIKNLVDNTLKGFKIHKISENRRYVLVLATPEGIKPEDWLGGPITIDKVDNSVKNLGSSPFAYIEMEKEHGEFKERH